MSLSPSAFVPAQQKHALMASLWPCWRDAPRRRMKKTSQSSQHCRLVVRKSRTHIHLVHLMRNKRTQRPQTSNRQIQSQRKGGETERSTKSKNPEVIEDLKIISSQLYYHWKTGSYFWNVMNDIVSSQTLRFIISKCVNYPSCTEQHWWAQLRSTASQLYIFIGNQHVIIRAFMQTQHNPCAASFRTPFTLWGLVGMVIYTQTEHSLKATSEKHTTRYNCSQTFTAWEIQLSSQHTSHFLNSLHVLLVFGTAL